MEVIQGVAQSPRMISDNSQPKRMKREKVNYSRKLTNGNGVDRNQGARRESLNGNTGKSVMRH
jgi:hypothetical protein